MQRNIKEGNVITIYGELYSTKNSKRILRAGNRLFIAKSAVSKAHDKQIEQQLVIYRKKWESLCAGKKYPLKVIFKIYRKTKRRFDYINIIQGVCDCMVRCGWLPDDDADHIIPCFEPYEVDSKNPRCEIRFDND